MPSNKPYPKDLLTYGDHIKKKRLDLNLLQSEVAKSINVSTDTIINWELNRTKPASSQIPKINLFLGYIPIIVNVHFCD
jgi:DNA-binding transcriptional regulator YiaG